MNGFGFLQDGAGNKSSGRLATLVTVAGIIMVWGACSVISVWKGTPPLSIPSEIIFLAGIVVTGKVTNSIFTEKK